MKKQTGFSLIELIMVIVISGIIVVTTSKILAEGFNALLKGKAIMEAMWQGQIALARMGRDIKAIRSTADISTSTASQLTFTDTGGNSVSYTLSGSTLTLNSQTLADGVSALSFSYYDSNGSTTAVTSNIRYIKIALTITQGNTNLSLTTSLYPRNLL